MTEAPLRISRTLGIEGGKLLRPDDDYEVLREFNESYDGTPTDLEELRLEYERLLQSYPELEELLPALPGRVFSGKAHPKPDTRAVFFCYRVPRPDDEALDEQGQPQWTEAAGETRWLLYDVASEDILESSTRIAEFIRSTPETPRHCIMAHEDLRSIRLNVEKHLRNTLLKQLQAPVGVSPVPKCSTSTTFSYALPQGFCHRKGVVASRGMSSKSGGTNGPRHQQPSEGRASHSFEEAV